MHISTEIMLDLEALVGHWIWLIGFAIEIFGVGMILVGIVWSPGFSSTVTCTNDIITPTRLGLAGRFCLD